MDSEPISKSSQSKKRERKPVETVWPYLLPFAAYMAISSFYPDIPPDTVDGSNVDWYFWLIAAQVIICSLLVAYFFRKIIQRFPIRMDFWGVLAGVVGVVVWIGLCELKIEATILGSVGMDWLLSERVGFNPFDRISDDARRMMFLVFRFSLLALVVPVIEELFLRGWFMRFMEDPNWEKVTLVALGGSAYTWSILYGVLTHPSEAIAAAAWFGMVTWLMLKTGKIWNCVLAHAITNLLLGIYVIYQSAWQYW